MVRRRGYAFWVAAAEAPNEFSFFDAMNVQGLVHFFASAKMRWYKDYITLVALELRISNWMQVYRTADSTDLRDCPRLNNKSCLLDEAG